MTSLEINRDGDNFWAVIPCTWSSGREGWCWDLHVRAPVEANTKNHLLLASLLPEVGWTRKRKCLWTIDGVRMPWWESGPSGRHPERWVKASFASEWNKAATQLIILNGTNAALEKARSLTEALRSLDQS